MSWKWFVLWWLQLCFFDCCGCGCLKFRCSNCDACFMLETFWFLSNSFTYYFVLKWCKQNEKLPTYLVNLIIVSVDYFLVGFRCDFCYLAVTKRKGKSCKNQNERCIILLSEEDNDIDLRDNSNRHTGPHVDDIYSKSFLRYQATHFAII